MISMKRKLILSAILTVLLSVVTTLFAFAEDMSETDIDESSSPASAFSFSDGKPLILYTNGNRITLFPVDMTVDLTDDGKVTSADARMILRHSAQIEIYTGSIENIDVTDDGNINALDARQVLRYSAHLDEYYRYADGSVFTGFCTTENNELVLVDSYGAVPTGLKTVDDSVYYFEKGVAATGTKTIGGSLYYFDNEGKGVNGDYKVNGKSLYFTDGKCFTGYRNVSGKNIYYYEGTPANGEFDVDGKKLYFKDGVLYTGNRTVGGKNIYYSQGIPANGYFEINGSKCYFENGTTFSGYKTVNGNSVYYANGIVANGFTTINSASYYFKNGIMQYGWTSINNDYYYLNRSNGKLAKSTTVDGIAVGSDGKAVKTSYNTEKIKTFIKARNIMLEITEPGDTVEEKKLKCFNWVMSCPYRQYRKVGASMSISGWEMLFANDIFNNGNGCCGSTSAAFAFLAVEAGCKSVYFCDDGVSTGGHAWVTMEGNNRVYDIIFAKSKGFNSNYDANANDYRSRAPRKTYIGG